LKENAKESLEEYIYQEIKSAILNRKIPVIMQLAEEQLGEAFKVSRTPIRSVLKRLQYEKMIRIVPNKGAYINQPSEKEIQEAFQLRTIIETEAVKMACRVAVETQLCDLDTLTYEEEKLYKLDEYAKGIQLTSEFHQGIVLLCGNELMAGYSQELINISNIYLALHDSADTESPFCSIEHRQIIQAIREKDEDKAVRELLNHFTTVKEHLDFNKEPETVQFSDMFKPISKKAVAEV
jgi:DNA-binding GntR family transcriptional regulator